jgi:hypothetical protein
METNSVNTHVVMFSMHAETIMDTKYDGEPYSAFQEVPNNTYPLELSPALIDPRSDACALSGAGLIVPL